MDKLALIKDALGKNQCIVTVKFEEWKHFLEREAEYGHAVRIDIAPKEGIYEVDQLQKILETLIVEVQPDRIRSFAQYVEVMEFGWLTYTEKIGLEKITRELTLTDKKFLHGEGFQNGRKIIEVEKSLMRSIWVYFYPDVEIASIISNRKNNTLVVENGMGPYWIQLDTLKQFRMKNLNSERGVSCQPNY